MRIDSTTIVYSVFIGPCPVTGCQKLVYDIKLLLSGPQPKGHTVCVISNKGMAFQGTDCVSKVNKIKIIKEFKTL